MSLRAFHLVFIAVSILVGLFCGIWGIWISHSDSEPMYLLVSFLGFLGSIWLGYYGVQAYHHLFGPRGGHV